MPPNETKKIFTYEQALEILPHVQTLTTETIQKISVIAAQIYALRNEDPKKAYEKEQAKLVNEWVQTIEQLGCEVKGLWLVDFDNGEGYYCWQYPEANLEYYHGYTEGFAGRSKLF
jgi:hypothetical protein